MSSGAAWVLTARNPSATVSPAPPAPDSEATTTFAGLQVVPGAVPILMRRSSILIASVCAAGRAARPEPPRRRPRRSRSPSRPRRDLKDPATRDQAFKDIAALGVHSMRLVLYWHDVAPQPDSRVKPKFDETDPASYDWSAYDAVDRRDQGARMEAAADRLGPGPALGHQRRTRHGHPPQPGRVPEVRARRRHPLRREGRHLEHLERAQPAAVPAAAVLAAQDAALAGDLSQALLRRPARPGRRRPGLRPACCWGRPRRAAPARWSRR